MAKYVTIMDIARELGISKSTVSRALSGDTSNVKAETLQKIMKTAHRMGYHRNDLAVHLRQQRTHNIGIIIPEIITTFYMTFINEVQAILRKQGYKVMIAISSENPKQERENLLMMEQLRVDGILMSVCDKDQNVDLYNKVIERHSHRLFRQNRGGSAGVTGTHGRLHHGILHGGGLVAQGLQAHSSHSRPRVYPKQS